MLHRCASHEGRRAPDPGKKCRDPLLTGSCPCRVASGRGRGQKRRRAGTEAVYNAPDGSVPKVLVQPLPVRVKAAEVRCMVSVLPGQPPEGKSAGQEASTGVWIQKCGVLWKDRKNDQELEYDLTCVSEGVTSTRNPSALVTAKEEMAPVRERPWPTQ